LFGIGFSVFDWLRSQKNCSDGAALRATVLSPNCVSGKTEGNLERLKDFFVNVCGLSLYKLHSVSVRVAHQKAE
jgi:hypothetical protein